MLTFAYISDRMMYILRITYIHLNCLLITLYPKVRNTEKELSTGKCTKCIYYLLYMYIWYGSKMTNQWVN